MIFWSVSFLKKKIRTGSFSESEQFTYAFLYLIFMIICLMVNGYYLGKSANAWDFIEAAGLIIIFFSGMVFAYRVNGGSNGKFFLGRFFGFLTVVSIRFLPIQLALVPALYVYYSYLHEQSSVVESTLFDITPSLLFQAAILWRVCVHIKAVNGVDHINN